MEKRVFTIGLIVFCVGAGSAFGDLSDAADPGASLQAQLDSITIGGSSSVDVLNDYIADDLDSTWHVTGSGGVHTILLEIADYAGSNILGLYDPLNTDNRLQVFPGPAPAGATRTVYVADDGRLWLDNRYDTTTWLERTPDATFGLGNAFGYYLDATAGNASSSAVFFSDTSDNADGKDHMYAYMGEGDYLSLPSGNIGPIGPSYYYMAWEDLLTNPDWDYTDMVVLVESVAPVPVPGAVLLGLLGMGVAGMRLRKRV